MIFLTAHEQCGVNVGRIDPVLPRSQMLVDQRLVDGLCTHGFVDGRRRRVDMGKQVRHRGLAGFAHMHHVPHPARRLFMAVAALGIIGGLDSLGGPG